MIDSHQFKHWIISATMHSWFASLMICLAKGSSVGEFLLLALGLSGLGCTFMVVVWVISFLFGKVSTP